MRQPPVISKVLGRLVLALDALDLLVADAVGVRLPLREQDVGGDGSAKVALSALIHDLLQLFATQRLIRAVQVLLAGERMIVAAAPQPTPAALSGLLPGACAARRALAALPCASDVFELVDERL